MTYTIEIATGDDPATGDSGEFLDPVFATGDIADVVVVRNGQQVIKFVVPTPLSTADTHTWHVRAKDGAGKTGDFSTSFSFNIGVDTTAPTVPTLISPAEASTSDDPIPTFLWSRVDYPSDVSYELQVSTTGDFSSLVVNTGDIIDTSFTPAVPLPQADNTPQQLFWRVLARDGAGNGSAFSGVGSFSIAAANLVVFSLEVSPRTGGPNTVFEIVAGVRNDGDSPGTETFQLTVDTSTVDHEVTLPPVGTTSIVRLVSVPPNLPPSGITSAGLHNVSVNGHNDHYRVVEPVIMTDVPTQYDVDPDTTQVTDAQGNAVDIVPGGQIIITGGSITLAIPGESVAGCEDSQPCGYAVWHQHHR